MRITRVYTRTGDKGSTRLAGGQAVSKDDARIEAYGTVDELNAVIGLVRSENARSAAGEAVVARIEPMLHRIQNDLFNVGADLATLPPDRWQGMVIVQDDDVALLERWMDELNEDLAPLREFILPGGGPVGSAFHLARTVCRRAERRLVTLMRAEPELDPVTLRYLNRLSDWLFVAGRWVAQAHGEAEHLWQRRQG